MKVFSLVLIQFIGIFIIFICFLVCVCLCESCNNLVYNFTSTEVYFDGSFKCCRLVNDSPKESQCKEFVNSLALSESFTFFEVECFKPKSDEIACHSPRYYIHTIKATIAIQAEAPFVKLIDNTCSDCKVSCIASAEQPQISQYAISGIKPEAFTEKPLNPIFCLLQQDLHYEIISSKAMANNVKAANDDNDNNNGDDKKDGDNDNDNDNDKKEANNNEPVAAVAATLPPTTVAPTVVNNNAVNNNGVVNNGLNNGVVNNGINNPLVNNAVNNNGVLNNNVVNNMNNGLNNAVNNNALNNNALNNGVVNNGAVNNGLNNNVANNNAVNNNGLNNAVNNNGLNNNGLNNAVKNNGLNNGVNNGVVNNGAVNNGLNNNAVNNNGLNNGVVNNGAVNNGLNNNGLNNNGLNNGLNNGAINNGLNNNVANNNAVNNNGLNNGLNNAINNNGLNNGVNNGAVNNGLNNNAANNNALNNNGLNNGVNNGAINNGLNNNGVANNGVNNNIGNNNAVNNNGLNNAVNNNAINNNGVGNNAANNNMVNNGINNNVVNNISANNAVANNNGVNNNEGNVGEQKPIIKDDGDGVNNNNNIKSNDTNKMPPIIPPDDVNQPNNNNNQNQNQEPPNAPEIASIRDKGRSGSSGTVVISSNLAGKVYCIAFAENEQAPDVDKLKSEGVSAELKENDVSDVKVTDLELNKRYNVSCYYEADSGQTKLFEPVIWSIGESYLLYTPTAEWIGNYSILVTVKASHPSTIQCVLASHEMDENTYPIPELESSKFTGSITENNGTTSLKLSLLSVKDFSTRKVICLGTREEDTKMKVSTIFSMNKPIVIIGELPAKGDMNLLQVTVPIACSSSSKGICQVTFPHHTLSIEELLTLGKPFDCESKTHIDFSIKPCREYVVNCISYDKSDVPYSVEESKRFGLCDPVSDSDTSGVTVTEIILVSFVVGLVVIGGIMAYRKYISPETGGLSSTQESYYNSKYDDDKYRGSELPVSYKEPKKNTSSSSAASDLRMSPQEKDYVTPQPVGGLAKKSTTEKTKRRRRVAATTDKSKNSTNNNYFAELGMETQ